MGDERKRGRLASLQQRGLMQLEACAREGLTIRAYAKREGLSEQQLYQIGKVLRSKGLLAPSRHGGKPRSPRVRAERKSRFVELQARALTQASFECAPSTWRARLPNGVMLEGNTGLEVVIEALAKL